MQHQTSAKPANEIALRSNRTILLAAFFSIVLILILIFGIVFISGEVRQYISFQHLIEELETGSLEKGQAALESYRADPYLFQLTKKVVYPFQDDASEERERATRSLSLVVTKIGLNDFQGAALLFRDMVLPRIDDILTSMPLSKQDKALLHAIIKRFDGWSEDVFTLAKLESTGPATLASNKAKIIEQSALGGDIAAQFAQFLTLPPRQYGPEEAMQFYKTGILKGLPVLPSLEDGIENVHDLKRKLDLIGGKPDVQGADAPQQFQERIDRLRTGSAIFRENIDRMQRENKSITKNLKTLRKTVYIESQRVREDIIALIKEVARPKISSPSRLTLQIFD